MGISISLAGVSVNLERVFDGVLTGVHVVNFSQNDCVSRVHLGSCRVSAPTSSTHHRSKTKKLLYLLTEVVRMTQKRIEKDVVFREFIPESPFSPESP